jgi:hypothetical protein
MIDTLAGYMEQFAGDLPGDIDILYDELWHPRPVSIERTDDHEYELTFRSWEDTLTFQATIPPLVDVIDYDHKTVWVRVRD